MKRFCQRNQRPKFYKCNLPLTFDNCTVKRIKRINLSSTTYNHVDLEEPQFFKFSRRPGLRRSSLRLLQLAGRIPRRRSSSAFTVVNNWNRLPLAAESVTEQRKLKKTILIYLFIKFSLYSIFAPIYGLFGHFIPSRSVNSYIHTFT